MIQQISPQFVSAALDAAGFQDVISPGSVVAIGGLFTDETAVAASVPLSLVLNDFSVTFNDLPGALFGVFDGPTFDQANAPTHPPSEPLTLGDLLVIACLLPEREP